MSHPPPSDPLDPLLERWGRNPPPSSPVTAEVWRRIAASENAPVPISWLARLEEVFARPSFALTFVAACTLLGLFLAQVRLTRIQSERNTQLVQSYLRLIDPLIETAAVPAKNTTAPQS